MIGKKNITEYCVIINEYQCPGFVDRTCSIRTTPSSTKVGEKGGVR
jgi:hypothetical protein